MIRNRVAQKIPRSGQQPRPHRIPPKLVIGFLVGALAPLLMAALTLVSGLAEELLLVVAPGVALLRLVSLSEMPGPVTVALACLLNGAVYAAVAAFTSAILRRSRRR